MRKTQKRVKCTLKICKFLVNYYLWKIFIQKAIKIFRFGLNGVITVKIKDE